MRLYLLCIALAIAASGAHLGHLGQNIRAAVLFACAAGVMGAWLFVRPVPKSVPEHNCKPSACCPGELLVPMHSTNTKLCTGCKTDQPWPLEPGQKRTFE